MSISELMMIPAQLNNNPSPVQAGRAQQMNMPNNVPVANRIESNWNGPNWPASFGRAHALTLGTSPFGRSVDMVDMATQLMEAGGELCSVMTCLWQLLLAYVIKLDADRTSMSIMGTAWGLAVDTLMSVWYCLHVFWGLCMPECMHVMNMVDVASQVMEAGGES